MDLATLTSLSVAPGLYFIYSLSRMGILSVDVKEVLSVAISSKLMVVASKASEGLKHEHSGHLIRDDVVRHVLLLRDNTCHFHVSCDHGLEMILH